MDIVESCVAARGVPALEQGAHFRELRGAEPLALVLDRNAEQRTVAAYGEPDADVAVIVAAVADGVLEHGLEEELRDGGAACSARDVLLVA